MTQLTMGTCLIFSLPCTPNQPIFFCSSLFCSAICGEMTCEIDSIEINCLYSHLWPLQLTHLIIQKGFQPTSWIVSPVYSLIPVNAHLSSMPWTWPAISERSIFGSTFVTSFTLQHAELGHLVHVRDFGSFGGWKSSGSISWQWRPWPHKTSEFSSAQGCSTWKWWHANEIDPIHLLETEFSGFGTRSASSQLLICRSL